MTTATALADAWHAIRAGQLDHARNLARRMLAAAPDDAGVLSLSGFVDFQCGDLAAARETLLRLLDLKPGASEPRNNLAAVLLREGRPEEAEKQLREAIRLAPGFVDAHTNLAQALRRQGRHAEARDCYEYAVSVAPGHVEALYGIASLAAADDDLKGAIDTLRRAVAARPADADTHSRLGSALAQAGHYDQALECYELALRLDPEHAQAHKRRALIWLRRGDFLRGWREYEWRFKCKPLVPPRFIQPGWDGSPLDGKTLLLQAEQGYGDTLQFVRYASLAKQAGGEIVLRCPRRMHALLSGCAGIDDLAAEEDAPPRFDCFATLMSLPRLFGTTLETIPADVPYLRADARLVKQWRDRLAPLTGFKIGIAWQGNPRYSDDRRRSVPLVEFAPLAEVPSVQFISLQKGAGSEQAGQLAGRFAVTELGAFDDAEGAFADSAAIMANLELVVTSDTAVAHLAGALGVPVWVALPEAADWRWLLDRDDSPWYPTMTLFRQNETRDWAAVFHRMAGHLRNTLSAMRKDEPLKVRPDTADWWNLRGVVLAESGRLAPGIVAFNRALDRRRDYADARNNLALALSRMDRANPSQTAEERSWHSTPSLLEQARHGRLANASEAEAEEAPRQQAVLAAKGDRASPEPSSASCFIEAGGESDSPGASSSPRLAGLGAAKRLTASGVAHALAGRFAEAIHDFRLALNDQPDFREAHLNLGAALGSLGHFDKAELHLRRAIALSPDWADAHVNLGAVLLGSGRRTEAEESFRHAARLNPASVQAHCNLANLLAALGNDQEAIEAYSSVVRLMPDHAQAQKSLAELLARAGQLPEAIAAYEAAVAARPDDANAFRGLGAALIAQGNLARAVGALREAVRLAPVSADTHYSLGRALAQQGSHDSAIACFRRAIETAADYGAAYSALGGSLAQQGEHDEARRHLDTAVRLNAADAEAHNNLGLLLKDVGHFDEALRQADQAVRLKPDFADAHFNRGLLHLLMGNLQAGWADYEWRRRQTGNNRRAPAGAEWDGSPLDGRSVLLYAEQGLGDTLQFIRFAAQAKRLGGVVYLRCPRSLVPLLSRSTSIDRVVAEGDELPSFDVQLPLLSVPHVLGVELGALPADMPYLFADPERIAEWQAKLRHINAFKVGICWQGNPNFAADRQRSVPLRHFVPLSKLPRVRLISLQKGPGTEQIGEIDEPFWITELGERFDRRAGAFMDAAAVIANLDLVVTSDTAMAHLAGALGAEVWLALSHSPDWRWMAAGERSPWYPSMRLFRQPTPRDWAAVFSEIAERLEKRAANAGTFRG